MSEPHPCESDAAGAEWWQRQMRLEEELWLADQAAQAEFLEWLDSINDYGHEHENNRHDAQQVPQIKRRRAA